MTRARDLSNLGSQAGSGLDASDITSGILPVGVVGGSGLNAVDPANLASGVLPVGVTGGSGLNAVGAGNLASGVLPSTVTGGSGLNAVNAANIAAGVLPVGVTGGSGLTAVNAANIASGVLPVGVTGGSGLTALGTVTAGNLSNSAIVYPAGHVVGFTHDITDGSDISVGHGQTMADSGIALPSYSPKDGSNILVVSFHCQTWSIAPPLMVATIHLSEGSVEATGTGDSTSGTAGARVKTANETPNAGNFSMTWVLPATSTSARTYGIYVTTTHPGEVGTFYIAAAPRYSYMNLYEIQQ